MKAKFPAGLKEIERKALNKIYNNDGKLTRYRLAKLLGIDKKRGIELSKNGVA